MTTRKPTLKQSAAAAEPLYLEEVAAAMPDLSREILVAVNSVVGAAMHRAAERLRASVEAVEVDASGVGE